MNSSKNNQTPIIALYEVGNKYKALEIHLKNQRPRIKKDRIAEILKTALYTGFEYDFHQFIKKQAIKYEKEERIQRKFEKRTGYKKRITPEEVLMEDLPF
ncbi:hypothetical protein KJ764_06005 [Patescibacteria group bacterium]|nr:hypothetical protein [Patescibacteria group bacterium]